MSLLGRIFVVINAVLVLTFLGMSAALYNYRQDYRTAYELLKRRHKEFDRKAKDEISALNSKFTDQEKFIDGKNREVREYKNEIDNLTQKFLDIEKNLSRRNDEFSKLQDEKHAILDRLGDQDDTIKALRTQLDDKKESLDRATRDKETAEAQVARLTRIKDQFEKDLGESRKNLVDSQKKLRDTELVLQILRNKGVPVDRLAYGQPLPLREGVIVGVDDSHEPALVVLSIGADEGVEKGWEFTVYRGNQFIGQVIVDKVMRDLSGARVLFTSDGAKIQKGDSVSTRID